MYLAIIAATFILGVALVLTGVVGIFGRFRFGRSGHGILKILGLELSGAGPVVILFAGVAMTMSGFGWAASQKEAKDARQEASRIGTELAASVAEKNEIVADAANVVEHARTLELQNRQLINAVQVAARTRQVPDTTVLNVRTLTVPKKLETAIKDLAP